MNELAPYINQVLLGDCMEILDHLPEKSVDMIFADPPYNLQLQHELWRPDSSRVEAVEDAWDKFENLREYDLFTRRWLTACRRVLKDTGTIWVIGTYHNIFRVGSQMQDIGYWFLNDVIWIKSNPMPNFRGVRFTNAHETLIWACKYKGAKYTFNHHAMKALNDDLQMRSDWFLPICTGNERVKLNGKKAHSTQKPIALLYRVIIACTNPGDIILDPFFGTGTTGVCAIKLRRHWIGIEKEKEYIQVAHSRISETQPASLEDKFYETRKGHQFSPRIPFASLLEHGLLSPGQRLYFQANRDQSASVRSDGHLLYGDMEGSIHKVGSLLSGNRPCNGWEAWFFEDKENYLRPINELRKNMRRMFNSPG
jgi:site-specific DNA-methyltransferase (adenine-specific)